MTMLQVNIEAEVKKEADKIIKDLGLTPSTAVRALYHQIIIKEGIPFDIKKESFL